MILNFSTVLYKDFIGIMNNIKTRGIVTPDGSLGSSSSYLSTDNRIEESGFYLYCGRHKYSVVIKLVCLKLNKVFCFSLFCIRVFKQINIIFYSINPTTLLRLKIYNICKTVNCNIFLLHPTFCNIIFEFPWFFIR